WIFVMRDVPIVGMEAAALGKVGTRALGAKEIWRFARRDVIAWLGNARIQIVLPHRVILRAHETAMTIDTAIREIDAATLLFERSQWQIVGRGGRLKGRGGENDNHEDDGEIREQAAQRDDNWSHHHLFARVGSPRRRVARLGGDVLNVFLARTLDHAAASVVGGAQSEVFLITLRRVSVNTVMPILNIWTKPETTMSAPEIARA